jgi:hypothetical protein
VDGDAVILSREGREVTAEFVDEFGGERIDEALPPLPRLAPDEPETDGYVELDHASVVSEEPPPLEPEDEEDEPYEGGLVSSVTTGDEAP